MKSRFLMIALVLVMALVPAVSAVAESGYVTVNLTFHPDYIASGADVDARMAHAKNQINKQFASLAAAQDAFYSLFTADGNYSGTSHDGKVYTDVGPLCYYAAYTPAAKLFTPIQGVEFVVHGTVPFGATKLTLAKVPDAQGEVANVTLRGADSSATITGSVDVRATVAGGYETTFVKSGTFKVQNIIFTETTAQTHIGADGQPVSGNATNKVTDSVSLVIEGCTFHNQLYHYLNDRSIAQLNTTIRNNTFDGKGYTGAALVLQHEQTTSTDGATVVIEGNTIENYGQGMQIQYRAESNVTVKGNTARNLTDKDRQFIQFTSGKTFTVENNNVTGVAGNVFRVHELAKGVVKNIVIRNNNIDESGYLLWNEAGDVPVSVTSNTILNTNVTQYYDKDAKATKNHPVDVATAFVKNNRLTVDVPVSAPSIPRTGDESHIALWIALMAISALSFVALGRKSRFN